MSEPTRIELPQRIEGYKTYVECGYETKFVCVCGEGHEVIKTTWRSLKEAMEKYAKRLSARKKKKKYAPVRLLRWASRRTNDAMEIGEAKVISIHAGSGNAIVKDGDATARQINGYDSCQYLVPMTDDEQDTLVMLHGDVLTAVKSYNKFKSAYEIEDLARWAELQFARQG